MVTVASMGGNVITLTLVLNIQNSAMENATAAWTSVETSVLFLWIRQLHRTSMCARTSASTTPWPARAAVQIQIQSSVGTDAWQTALQITTTSVMGSASHGDNPVMATVLRDMWIAKDTAILNQMLTTTFMIVMELASQSLDPVTESVLRDM